jgi:hypothetical protein
MEVSVDEAEFSRAERKQFAMRKVQKASPLNNLA